MTSITIPLTEDRLTMLNELAAGLGISVEALVRSTIEDLLTGSDDEEYDGLIERVLQKNAELYRRLA